MNNILQDSLLSVASLFDIQGEAVNISPLGDGLINDTYLVLSKDSEKRTHKYVLQRINTDVFKNPELLQSNLKTLTAHIRNILEENGTPDIERRVLTCVDTRDGKDFLYADRKTWRMTKFIPDTVTFKMMTPEMAEATGCAFGQFHTMLAAKGVPELGETIPGFHNMPNRIDLLQAAVDNNAAGRLEEVKDIVETLMNRKFEMTLAERLYEEGKLPRRICHCDTKVDNILFDKNGDILCVIDLDTTMPGFVMSDFGDFIRTAANTGKEDDRSPENVSVDMEIFRKFAKGYVSEANFLTEEERNSLAHGAQRLTYMQAVRFLTDYLNGDTYYKIAYPDHNLVRTRAQMKLLHSIDENMESMNEYIKSLI